MKREVVTHSRSIAAAYATGRNGLNLIRLALAVLVIVSHAWPIGGYGADPEFLGVTLGHWAVIGFFGISGYLITASREHHEPLPFLIRRALRIYPAFWAVIAVTAFVFAPIAAAMTSASYGLHDGLRYLRYTFTLQMHTFQVGDTLKDAPMTAWDGSLWTLKYEYLCYLLIGLLFTVRRLRLIAVLALFVAAAVHSWIHGDDLSGFVAVFAAGSLLALSRRRIPVTWWLAIPAAGLVVVGAAIGHVYAVAGLGLAYLLLSAGAVLPPWRFVQRNDLSYGMYIYAFPVAQLLLLAGVGGLPVGVVVTLDIVATIPLAVASWYLIEAPAQRFAPTLDRAWSKTVDVALRRPADTRPENDTRSLVTPRLPGRHAERLSIIPSGQSATPPPR